MKGYNPTKKELEEAKEANKIRGFVWSGGKKNKAAKAIPQKVFREKKWINVQLHEWGMKKGIVITKEFEFSAERNWRFDWCFIYKKHKIAVEYEGINSRKSRHTTKTGFTGDTDKYNAAQHAGWKVWRYTALNFRNLEEDLKSLL